jgi:hypothetical protein
MYANWDVLQPLVEVPFRSFVNFEVKLDATRPYHPEVHKRGIIGGTYSGTHAEKLSDYSYSGWGGSSKGGSSVGSGDRGNEGGGGGAGSSSYGFAKKGSGTGGKSSSTLALAGQAAIGTIW